jgi:hypothetical protein
VHRRKGILNGLLIGCATCELLYNNNQSACWFNPAEKNFLKNWYGKKEHKNTVFHWGKSAMYQSILDFNVSDFQ